MEGEGGRERGERRASCNSRYIEGIIPRCEVGCNRSLTSGYTECEHRFEPSPPPVLFSSRIRIIDRRPLRFLYVERERTKRETPFTPVLWQYRSAFGKRKKFIRPPRSVRFASAYYSRRTRDVRSLVSRVQDFKIGGEVSPRDRYTLIYSKLSALAQT